MYDKYTKFQEVYDFYEEPESKQFFFGKRIFDIIRNAINFIPHFFRKKEKTANTHRKSYTSERDLYDGIEFCRPCKTIPQEIEEAPDHDLQTTDDSIDTDFWVNYAMMHRRTPIILPHQGGIKILNSGIMPVLSIEFDEPANGNTNLPQSKNSEEKWAEECKQTTAKIISTCKLNGNIEKAITNEMTRTYIDDSGQPIKESLTSIYKVTRDNDCSSQFEMSAEDWIEVHKKDVHFAYNMDEHGLVVLINNKRALWFSEKEKLIKKGVTKWKAVLLDKVVFPKSNMWLKDITWEAFKDLFCDSEVGYDAFYRARRKYIEKK